MEKEQQILDVFAGAGKPLKAGDVAEISGIAKDEVTKIITKLKKAEKIVSPKACFYEIKK